MRSLEKGAFRLKNSVITIPHCRRISPTAVFQRIYAGDRFGFIYESCEHTQSHGRYSFIGGRPVVLFRSKGFDLEIQEGSRLRRVCSHPFTEIRALLTQHAPSEPSPVFPGGAIGYVAYDAIRLFEKIPDRKAIDIDVPDMYFLIPSEIIVFDHKEDTVVVSTMGDGARSAELAGIIRKTDMAEDVFPTKRRIEFCPAMSQEFFCSMVREAQQLIHAGDIFQVVLSQRISAPITSSSLSLYRALRFMNPSPYMYYLNLDTTCLLGSSPETLVKVEQRQVTSSPIAGTRPRGANAQEDAALADDLIQDEKELAEHIMLVDLARNDIGRVSAFGSVRVTELLKVEKYARVMHITSNVTGILQEGCDAFDAFAATFPAGTVSGAPKIRAMEIIDQLEPVRRGIYAGAIGYFSFNGDMDFCIAIRTIVLQNQIAYIQGGAGIVADSVPEREYRETLDKISALQSALEIAR